MNPRSRRTLRDFDEEAIAQPEDAVVDDAAADDEPAAPPPAASTSRATRAKRAPVTTARAKPEIRKTSETTRTGLYFHPATFEAAKSAYLVDFDALPDSADSFARWISAALAAHAAMTPADRATAADELPGEPRSGSGFTRSFELDDNTIQAMESAITEDRRSHRFVTRSQFGNEAVRVAIEAAKTRTGGVLPPAPARLPNRPVR